MARPLTVWHEPVLVFSGLSLVGCTFANIHPLQPGHPSRCDLCKHCLQGLDYILAVAGSRKIKAWTPRALYTCLFASAEQTLRTQAEAHREAHASSCSAQRCVVVGHAAGSSIQLLNVYLKHERRAFAQTIIVPFNNWLEPDVGDGRVRVRARHTNGLLPDRLGRFS